MFNLTTKSAKHFKLNWKELPVHDGDFWRIEICYINRKKYLLVVHEQTFSTNLLRAVDFPSFELIAEFINECNPWYRFSGISVGKKENRQLTGTITDMKSFIPHFRDDCDHIEIEKVLNETPWFALPSYYVDKEIEKYIKTNPA